jgi:hypothetical protein
MLTAELAAGRFTFAHEDEAVEAFHERRWTDGLPIVLPTVERVRAMVAGSGRHAGEVIGVVPPRWAEATVENIAINAVMAGCLPSSMPLLIAAVQAACDPAFGLYSVQATTHPCAVMLLVSGEPFRVTRGFGRDDNTVTVFSGEGPHNVNDHVCTSAHTTLTVIADTMTTIGHNNAASVIRGDVLVALGPEHAHTIASGRLSKPAVQRFLFEHARNKVGLLKLRAMYKEGNWPDWVDREDDEALCPIVGKPEDIHIVVTGGPGKHSAFIPTFGTSKSVTRKIES